MMDWQPIDTLPLDGTLKLFCTRAGEIYIAPAVEFEPASPTLKREIYERDGTWPNADFLPSHWMPLPKAAEASE